MCAQQQKYTNLSGGRIASDVARPREWTRRCVRLPTKIVYNERKGVSGIHLLSGAKTKKKKKKKKWKVKQEQQQIMSARKEIN